MVDKEIFSFKQFDVYQHKCAMKVGTDAVLLGSWAQGGEKILDIGCGTGIISLMMAQRYPEAQITAIDIVADCCVQTRENADRTPWGDRIEVVNKSLQDYVTLKTGAAFDAVSPEFDAIVSNPPFFVNSMKNPDKHRTLARHTDSLPFSSLARGVARLLKDDGVFCVMLTEECFREFTEEAWFSGLYLAEDIALKPKATKPVKRHLMKFVKDRNVVAETHTYILQNADGTKTDWYKKFADEFYL